MVVVRRCPALGDPLGLPCFQTVKLNYQVLLWWTMLVGQLKYVCVGGRRYSCFYYALLQTQKGVLLCGILASCQVVTSSLSIHNGSAAGLWVKVWHEGSEWEVRKERGEEGGGREREEGL